MSSITLRRYGDVVISQSVGSFCQRVKSGLLRVAGYVAWITESSVVMPEMVEEEDDVGRGGCC